MKQAQQQSINHIELQTTKYTNQITLKLQCEVGITINQSTKTIDLLSESQSELSKLTEQVVIFLPLPSPTSQKSQL